MPCTCWIRTPIIPTEVLETTEIGGHRIEEGDEVIALIGAANRDPERFPDPDGLDIGRQENRHLAFGGGIHFCLGASQARAEGRTALGAMIRRFPDLALAGEPVWRDTFTLRGLTSLRISV